MKKHILMLSVLALVSVLVTNGCTYEYQKEPKHEPSTEIEEEIELLESVAEVKYDNKLLEMFEKKEYVSVTVSFKVRDLDFQQNLLALLKEEFRLIAESKTGRGFSGELSRKGFEELLTNKNISSILLETKVEAPNLSTAVYVLEIAGKTSAEITSEVSNLINVTKS